jgi:FkbM family methyltransferase
MDAEKYRIAVEAAAGIRAQVFSDAWRGSFRQESFTEKFVEAAARSRVFVDAGAEFGFYTWLALKHMPAQRRLVLFEPEPERCAALAHVLADVPEATVLPYALGASRSTVRLYKESVQHSCTLDAALSQSSNARPAESFVAEVVALDDIFETDPAAVDLVKMDIEGAEVFALQGMERILAAGRAEMFLEFHPRYVESCLPGGVDLVRRLLDRHNYNLFACRDLECVPADLDCDRIYLKPGARA